MGDGSTLVLIKMLKNTPRKPDNALKHQDTPKLDGRQSAPKHAFSLSEREIQEGFLRKFQVDANRHGGIVRSTNNPDYCAAQTRLQYDAQPRLSAHQYRVSKGTAIASA